MGINRKNRGLIILLATFALFFGAFAFAKVSVASDKTAFADGAHVHDDITFSEWTETNGLPTVAGSYYLTADVTISSTWNVPSGTTSLCLNGHGIKMTGYDSVIKVGEGSTLKLYDCDTETEHRYSVSSPAANGAGVASVNDALTSGYQTFIGGYITGGYSPSGYRYGAGINLEGNGASLYMYGGTIIGNRLTAGTTGGGGVCVQDWDSSGGFYMYGGSIVGNTSNYGGGVYVRCGKMELNGGNVEKNVAKDNIGGGILVFGGNSTLVVKDGSISDNKAVHGGAVEASGEGTVTISGGSFTNNIATSRGGALTNQRTDGDTSPAVFNISGAPVFSGNTAGGYASDIYLCNTAVINLNEKMTNTTAIGITKASGTGTFTSGWSTSMGDANPADYFTSDAGYFVALQNGEATITDTMPHFHDGINFTAWTLADSLPTSAGNYYLKADVTISSTWSVPSGTTKLCLNGHGIKMTGNNSVVTVKAGATLKLYDCDTTTEHKYSVSNAKSNGAGLAIVNDALTSGYQTFKGGYITGGIGAPVNSWSRGGAFYIEGTVEMYGGTVIGNGRYDNTHGGGFNTQGSGTFKMYGGSIQNNAGKCGGATRLQGTDGSCEIYGGKIINNIVSADGGAIHVGGSIPVILQNCEISGNYANSGPGAGIWMTTTGTEISGRTIITNNLTNSGQSNVEIGNVYVISVGELTEGASVGIKINNVGTGTFTSGWATSMGDANPSDYFTSDNGSYEIRLSDGEAYVGVHVHNWTYTVEGNVITATCAGVEKGTCNLSDQTLTITADGKTYDGTAVVATLSFSDGWTTVNGLEIPSIYYSDGVNAATTTAPVSVGTYTASITVGEKTATVEFEITRKTETKIDDKTEDEQNAVSVVGLDLELANIENKNPDANSISLVMTVEQKTEGDLDNADKIIKQAEDKSFVFFEIKVEKTIDSVTTTIDETSNVMEIVVPYEKVNKRGLTVYSYHNEQVRVFVESDTKEDGTFRVDKENKLIYIYADKFSTYAIGYTPYYRVQISLSLGSYTDKASVTIRNDANKNIAFTAISDNVENIVFPDVPKGLYTMTVTWEDGKTNALKMKLSVGPKIVLSLMPEQDAENEEEDEQIEESETLDDEPSLAAIDEPELFAENEITEICVNADSGSETLVVEKVGALSKAQGTNSEIGLIPKKREYTVKREYIKISL